MNQRKNYRRSSLFTISQNPSPLIFLCPYVLLSSSALRIHWFSKMPPFYVSGRGPSLAQNSRSFNALVCEKPVLRRSEGILRRSVSEASEYPPFWFAVARTSTLLRRATPRRGVLLYCMSALISFSFFSLLRVFLRVI